MADFLINRFEHLIINVRINKCFNFTHEIVKKNWKNVHESWILNSEEQIYQQFPSAGENYGTT